MNTPERLLRDLERQPQRLVSRRVAAKSIIATAAVVGGTLGAVWYSGTSGFLSATRADNVSDAEKQERIKVFAALGALPISLVTQNETERALDSMNLPTSTRESILANLDRSRSPSVRPAQAEKAQVTTSPSPNAKDVAQSEPAPSEAGDLAIAHSAAAQKRMPSQLAWVTLWDSDVEDGDAVRIESGGYARTVVLTKRGDTFAIPVPSSGQIHLIGVRDGDGGGITIGLASGAARVILPVMSVGQVLALNVALK